MYILSHTHFFIHSLGCFILWILLQWTWGCRYLFNILFSLPLDIYSEVRLLDYIVILFLIFWGISILFSLMDAPIYIWTNRAQGFLFSISFPTLFLSCLFYNIHPNMCEVISHCGFDLHFTDYWWCWVPFQVTVGHLYVFTEKINVYSSSLPIF